MRNSFTLILLATFFFYGCKKDSNRKPAPDLSKLLKIETSRSSPGNYHFYLYTKEVVFYNNARVKNDTIIYVPVDTGLVTLAERIKGKAKVKYSYRGKVVAEDMNDGVNDGIEGKLFENKVTLR
jgi:hypothetical protein